MDAQLRRLLTWCKNQNVLDADAVQAVDANLERYVSEQREPGTAVPKLQFDHVCGSTVCDNPADCRLCKNTLIKRCGTANVKKNFKNRYRGTETILPYCKSPIICRPVGDAQKQAPPFECVSHIRIYLINDEKYKATFEQDHTRFPTWANLQPLIIKDRPAGSRQTLFKDSNNSFLTRAVERTEAGPHDFSAVISSSDGPCTVVPLPSQTAFNSKEKGYRLIGVACQHSNPGAASSSEGALELEEMNDILPAISEPFRVGTAGRPDKPLSESDVIEDIRGLDKACIALRSVDDVVRKALVQRFRLVRRLEKNEALGPQDEAGLQEKQARFKAALLRAIAPSTTIGTVRDFREFARLVDGDPDLKGQVSLALGLTDDGWNKVAVPHANTAMPLDSDDRMYRVNIPGTACFFRLLYRAINGAPAFAQGPHSFELELLDEYHPRGALLFTEPATNLHWHAVVQHYTRLAETDWAQQASASADAHPNWDVVTEELKPIPVPEETCQEWRKHLLQQLQLLQWQQQLCAQEREQLQQQALREQHERQQEEEEERRLQRLQLQQQAPRSQQRAQQQQQQQRQQQQQPGHADTASSPTAEHPGPGPFAPHPLHQGLAVRLQPQQGSLVQHLVFTDPPTAILVSMGALEAGQHQQQYQHHHQQQHQQQHHHQQQHQQLFLGPSDAPPAVPATRPHQLESLLNNSSFLKPGNLPPEPPPLAARMLGPPGDAEIRSLPISELNFHVSDRSMAIHMGRLGTASAAAPGAASSSAKAASAPGDGSRSLPADAPQGQRQGAPAAAAEPPGTTGLAPSPPLADPRRVTGQVRTSHSLRLPGMCSAERSTKRALTQSQQQQQQPHDQPQQQQQHAESLPHPLPHPQPPPLPLFAPPPPSLQQPPLLSPFFSAGAPPGARFTSHHPPDQHPTPALSELPAHRPATLPSQPPSGPAGQHPTSHPTQATPAEGTPAPSVGGVKDAELESSTALDSMQAMCVGLPPVAHGETKALLPASKA